MLHQNVFQYLPDSQMQKNSEIFFNMYSNGYEMVNVVYGMKHNQITWRIRTIQSIITNLTITTVLYLVYDVIMILIACNNCNMIDVCAYDTISVGHIVV